MINKYLIVYQTNGKLEEPVIETASQIFSKMDINNIEIISINHLRPHRTADEFRLDMHPFMPCYVRQEEIKEMFGEGRVLDRKEIR